MFQRTLRMIHRATCRMMNPATEESPATSRLCLSTTSWGLLVSFTSGLFISVVTLLVKYLKDIYPGLLTASRFGAISSFALPQLILARENIFGAPKYRVSILLTGITNSAAAFLQFLSFRYLPYEEAAVLISCYPIFVAISGRIFRKEPFGLLQVIALLAIVIGMILTTHLYQTFFNSNGDYNTQYIYGITAGVAAALSASVSLEFMRKLKNINSSVLAFNIGIVGIIVSTIITGTESSFSFKCSGFLERGLILLIGLFSYLGYICVIVSVQYAEPRPVSILRSASDIFFSVILQSTILRDVPDSVTILGASLVCISILLLGIRQYFPNFLRWRNP